MGNLVMKSSQRYKFGFTITELSIATGFIAVLLILIASLIMHLTSLYQKGLSLKSVNSTGQNIIDHVTRSFGASPSESLSTLCNYLPEHLRTGCSGGSNAGYNILFQQKYTNDVKIVKGNITISGQVPTSGALCTGNFSYVWNTGYVLDSDIYAYADENRDIESEQAKLTYNGQTYEGFRLLAVRDEKRQVCTSAIEKSGSYASPSNQHVIENGTSEPTELLAADTENPLALYDFQLFLPTYHESSHHSFYSGNFILATIRGGININSAGDFCTEPPDNLSSDFAYCAINKFEFATRATGEKKYVDQF